MVRCDCFVEYEVVWYYNSTFVAYTVFLLSTHTNVFVVLLDKNYEETAIAAYWITDGVDRCRMGFLPRHCIPRASFFDGHIVQVVALLAQSENSSERQHSRKNRGVAYASIIDSKSEGIATHLNEPALPAASIHALAASILASGSSGSDNDEEEEYPKTKEYSKKSDDE
jgi:hypothetical protein